jgi:hypothetical protein
MLPRLAKPSKTPKDQEPWRRPRPRVPEKKRFSCQEKQASHPTCSLHEAPNKKGGA